MIAAFNVDYWLPIPGEVGRRHAQVESDGGPAKDSGSEPS